MGVKRASFYQIDAFIRVPFKGNPAVICMIPVDLEDDLYVTTARALCGHATLAAAHLIYTLGYSGESVTFHTKAGELYATCFDDGIVTEFPRNDPFPVQELDEVNKALGVTHIEIQYTDTNMKLLIEIESEDEVTQLAPDFQRLLSSDNPHGWFGIIVTSKSTEYDFFSRYFAPWRGVNKDPVTGYAHTVIGPYWSKKLGKNSLRAYQSSERGGEIGVEMTPDRVRKIGQAVTVVEGTLTYST